MLDPSAIANAVAAVACASIAVVTWRRRTQNLAFAVALTVVMVSGCWWSVTLAVVVGSTNETVAAVATLATFPGSTILVTAFMCLGITIVRPQWMPRPWMVAALLVEPVLITLVAMTNPWHLLVYRGAGTSQLTGSAGWTFGPVWWLDTAYGYCLVGAGLALVGWGWWRASPAFRGQRLAVLLAAVVPVALNAAFLVGGLDSVSDPTPLGFAATGTILWYAIFRQDLFTFNPVARALIIDQIGDAVVVISPSGRVLDLNPIAERLARALNPAAPARLVGAPAQDVFGEGIAAVDERETEVVVDFPGGRAEFQVRGSLLADRHHRALGTALVMRDVTEANVLSRRLNAAHAQLVRQVETIDLLRADLVELAGRDPLTGLHNRRYLVEEFASMLAAAGATGASFAVALFDVDKFKSVNDRYGHLAGDEVLVSLAKRMVELAPPNALVARLGGDEFVVALPGADAGTGLTFADEVRRRCAQDAIGAEGRTMLCTVSAGIAIFPASGTTMDELLDAADAAMYVAKRADRNVVRLALDRAESTAVGLEAV